MDVFEILYSCLGVSALVFMTLYEFYFKWVKFRRLVQLKSNNLEFALMDRPYRPSAGFPRPEEDAEWQVYYNSNMSNNNHSRLQFISAQINMWNYIVKFFNPKSSSCIASITLQTTAETGLIFGRSFPVNTVFILKYVWKDDEFLDETHEVTFSDDRRNYFFPVGINRSTLVNQITV